MSYELIAALMFATMMLMLQTGQRVFGAIGFVAGLAALLLWGDGGSVMPFSAGIKLMKWYPLLTLPMFVFMGYIMSESRIADDLYRMFHVWMGPVHGGPCGRHHFADGCHLGHERPVGRGHGNRRDDRAAGNCCGVATTRSW